MTRHHRWIFMTRWLTAVATLALAGLATAQQAAAQGTSNAFDQACVDLMHGKTPKGEKAIETLRDACASLMKTRTEEARRTAEQQEAQAALREEQPAKAPAAPKAKSQTSAKASSSQANVKAGTSAAQVGAGTNVLAAFGQAGGELVGSRQRGMMGMSGAGRPIGYTVTTNPVGWFTGIGVNADFSMGFMEKFSWTAGSHYSMSAATDRTLYTLGFLGGVDWFIIGRNNEGLRIGPRLDYSFGREQSTGTQTRQRLGMTGEVGYNFIATNGITGEAAFGLGGRVAGDKNEQLSSGAGGEFGPYVKLGVGYSW